MREKEYGCISLWGGAILIKFFIAHDWSYYNIEPVAKLLSPQFIVFTPLLFYHGVTFNGGASWSNVQSVGFWHYETK